MLLLEGKLEEDEIDRQNICCMTDEQILQLCNKAVQVSIIFTCYIDSDQKVFRSLNFHKYKWVYDV